MFKSIPIIVLKKLFVKSEDLIILRYCGLFFLLDTNFWWILLVNVQQIRNSLIGIHIYADFANQKIKYLQICKFSSIPEKVLPTK